MTAESDDSVDSTDSVGRAALARLTFAKAIANTALRWIPPFLPTLERAFGATTAQLTTILGVGEMAGLSTVAVGKPLDRGREREVMTGGLVAITVSSLIALVGTIVSFAVAFLFLILGVANLTVAGHAWISHRVDYRWRARAIGVFETSWAFALLIGAPIIAILINVVGWRGPFVALAIASGFAALMVWMTTPPSQHASRPGSDAPPVRTPLHAWLTVFGSALMAMAGLSVYVISGTWLNDAFGVSTGGLGLIAMGFGAFELMASSSSAALADRAGKRRSTFAGLAVQLAGVLVMASADSNLVVGVIGLLLFLLGFEFGFVTSLSLISEAVPTSRGRTLAIANGIGTVARGSGTIASGALYTAYGIGGTLTLSATAAVAAVLCFALSQST